MKTKSDNPSPATLLKREQRERLSKGVPNAKGRVNQCTLANDALSKSNPKERLQELMQDNKISVMGLKRCFKDGTIDETALCLLGIPFRRKTVEKTPNPKPKNKPNVPTVLQVELPKLEEIKTSGFVERNALHSHDNVANRTKAEADIANALVKIQQELARQDQLAENEKRMVAKSTPVPKVSPQTLKQLYLDDERLRLAMDLVNQSGMSLLKIPVGSVRSVLN
jgi:hypothetical protein